MKKKTPTIQSSPVAIHFDAIAPNYDRFKRNNFYYYKHLKHLLKSLVAQKKLVLEIGCGTGDLLYCLNPRIGVGVDISKEMIKLAQKKHQAHKNLRFITTDLSLSFAKQRFDYIFMCDVIEHLENPDLTFKKIYSLMSPETTLVITMANPIWEPVLMIVEKMKLKMPEGPHHRMTFKLLNKTLSHVGFRLYDHSFYLPFPIYVPFLSELINSLFKNRFKHLHFIEYATFKKS